MRRLGCGILEWRAGTRRQRVDAGDRPRLDVDSTGLHQLRLNVGGMRRRLDGGIAGRNADPPSVKVHIGSGRPPKQGNAVGRVRHLDRPF